MEKLYVIVQHVLRIFNVSFLIFESMQSRGAELGSRPSKFFPWNSSSCYESLVNGDAGYFFALAAVILSLFSNSLGNFQLKKSNHGRCHIRSSKFVFAIYVCK